MSSWRLETHLTLSAISWCPIFLRMLDYYEGILFLTTNRVKHIDDAFHSRIHVSLHYPPLKAVSRRQISGSFSGHLGDAELDALAKVEIDRCQI